jgi:peptide-methionine (R)-S-oxide reductase
MSTKQGLAEPWFHSGTAPPLIRTNVMKTEQNFPKSNTRRGFFTRLGAFGALGAVAGGVMLPRLARVSMASAEPSVIQGTPGMVKIVPFTKNGLAQPAVTVPKIVKTDAEWKAQLDGPSFQVAREAGTERAYTGPYWNLHDKGLYHCVCCDTAAFNSNTKFESGTGWPSFYEPIAKENIKEITDNSFGMTRTAVSCARCDAHLGHVFDDGPKPTGLRYCMNSVALKFVKA